MNTMEAKLEILSVKVQAENRRLSHRDEWRHFAEGNTYRGVAASRTNEERWGTSGQQLWKVITTPEPDGVQAGSGTESDESWAVGNGPPNS